MDVRVMYCRHRPKLTSVLVVVGNWDSWSQRSLFLSTYAAIDAMAQKCGCTKSIKRDNLIFKITVIEIIVF